MAATLSEGGLLAPFSSAVKHSRRWSRSVSRDPMPGFQVSANSPPRGQAGSLASGAFCFDHLPELRISAEEDRLLNCLIAEDVAGESASDRAVGDVGILPIEWVVDIADKDNDWFIATAYTYNDTKQMVHVMVPDRKDPMWEGDVPLNPLVLRLLECCDGRSMALFKQVVRESGLEVDWSVRITRNSVTSKVENTEGEDHPDRNPTNADNATERAITESATTTTIVPGPDEATLPPPPRAPIAPLPRPTPSPLKSVSTTFLARAVLLLPLGSYVVIDVESCDKNSHDEDTTESGNAGGQEVVQLDDRLELVECRGDIGSLGEKAFYRLAEEGLVACSANKDDWMSFKERQAKDDVARRLKSSTIFGLRDLIQSEDTEKDHTATVVRGLGKEMRILVERSLKIRDDLLQEHLASLERVRRLVLDGDLEAGAMLMAEAAHVQTAVVEERHAHDKSKLMSEVSALEAVIKLATDRIQTAKPQAQAPMVEGTNGDEEKGGQDGEDGNGDQAVCAAVVGSNGGEGGVTGQQEASECVDAKTGLKGGQEGRESRLVPSHQKGSPATDAIAEASPPDNT